MEEADEAAGRVSEGLACKSCSGMLFNALGAATVMMECSGGGGQCRRPSWGGV